MGGEYAYFRAPGSLVLQIPAHPLYQLHLLLQTQPRDGQLHDVTEIDLVLGDESLVIYEGKEAHDELAIHPVGHATVSRDRVAKVLDLEGTLEARSKETAERRDQRGEAGQDDGVELHGLGSEGEAGSFREEKQLRQGVRVLEEDGVRVAHKTREDTGTEVVDGADEVFRAHQDVR